MPTGNLHPFAGQIFYKDLNAMVEGADTHYELRTGGKYAVVTLGDQEQPNTAVVSTDEMNIDNHLTRL